MKDALDPLVTPERRAGLLIDRIELEGRAHNRKRPRAFSAREALICLEFEALLVMTAACNLANEVELTDEDRQRLILACSRIQTITDEVTA